MSLERRYVDILTMGRSGIDIFPLQVGAHLEDVETFGKFLGGSPTNVAVAAARLGHRSGVITGVGDDPFGRFVTRELERLGVSSDHVVTVRDFHTPEPLLSFSRRTPSRSTSIESPAPRTWSWGRIRSIGTLSSVQESSGSP